MWDVLEWILQRWDRAVNEIAYEAPRAAPFLFLVFGVPLLLGLFFSGC